MYVFMAPINIESRTSPNSRRDLLLNRRHGSYTVSVTKLMHSIDKFLHFIRYIYHKNIDFLTLSSRLYRPLVSFLSKIKKSSHLQLFSALSPRSLLDKVALNRFRLFVIRSLLRADINIIFLLNQDSYTQLLRALAASNFFLVGVASLASEQKTLSLSLPSNRMNPIL